MRYWHKKIDHIVDYVLANSLRVTVIDLWGKNPRVGGVEQLIGYFEQSQDVIADDTLDYIVVSNKEPDEPGMCIQDEILRIESNVKPTNFVVHAYADGGVISFSGSRLPFQHEDADPAEWWKIENMTLRDQGPNPWRV